MIWPTKRLDELFAIARGGSPRPIDSHLTDDPSGMPWIMIGDTKPGSKYLAGTKKRIRRSSASHSRVIEPGAFLLTNSMSFGRPYISKIQGCIHDGWLVLAKKSDEIDDDYFYHVLSSSITTRQFERLAAGATVKNLNKELVAKVMVPLPPIEEQRRIAAILDKAEELRAKSRATLALLDELPQAIFLEMFGDHDIESGSWPTLALAEVVEPGTVVTYGIVQAGEEFEGGVPYIRTGDIVNGEINGASLRHTDPHIAAKFRRSRVSSGDIVMSIRATVGTTASIPNHLEGANLTQGTAKISPGPLIDRAYLLNYLRMPRTQSWIARQVKGATFREITLERLRELPVQMPPIELQRGFSSRFEQVQYMNRASKSAIRASASLYATLQTNAFCAVSQATGWGRDA